MSALETHDLPFELPPVTVVTGHYGTGKTSFALNLAFDAVAAGLEPTLIDLDVVNPYFRSSDLEDQLEKRGVHVIGPVFAHTTLDTPSLSPAIPVAIENATSERPVILDAGGDDAGAFVLGQYREKVKAKDHQVLFVVNRYRDFAADADEYIQVAGEIVGASGIKLTGVVNNSHMMQETTAEQIAESVSFVGDLASRMEVPVLCTTVPQNRPGVEESEGISVAQVLEAFEKTGERADLEEMAAVLYPVNVYLHAPWEE